MVACLLDCLHICLPGIILLLSVDGGECVLLSTEPSAVLVRINRPHNLTLSAFRVFLYFHHILLQLEYGPDVCGVLCLTRIVFMRGSSRKSLRSCQFFPPSISRKMIISWLILHSVISGSVSAPSVISILSASISTSASIAPTVRPA